MVATMAVCPERTQPRYRHQSTGHFVGLGTTNDLLFQFVDIRSLPFPLPSQHLQRHARLLRDCARRVLEHLHQVAQPFQTLCGNNPKLRQRRTKRVC
jgi:hypothetical protein